VAVQRLYMVRAGRGGKLANDYIARGIVAVAWARMGSLIGVSSEMEIRRRLFEAYADSPTWRPSKHYMEIVDFVLAAGPGTRVVTVDSPNRRFLVGTIDGPYEYWPDSTMRANEELYRNIRRVKWDSVVGFDDLRAVSRKETDLQNRSAVWLSPSTSADILSNLSPLSATSGSASVIRDDVQPVSKAPADAAELSGWVAENERKAFDLPSDYVALKAAAAPREPRVVETNGTQYVRDPYVAAHAKQLACGVCDLCRQDAPFLGNGGAPYLEAHHVEWLSRGGADAVDNVAALCPNCHRKMHILDRRSDVTFLVERLAAREL
jgi:5-methylcytosine-specific restriction endonuclease McrA